MEFKFSEKYYELAELETNIAIGLGRPADLIDIANAAILSLDEKESKDMLERVFYNKYCSDELKSDIKKMSTMNIFQEERIN